jgi:hypothetical protein
VALADDLERERAALTMIHGQPFNAEAPPEALETDITPTEMHYVRSNFAVPAHDGGTPAVPGAGCPHRLKDRGPQPGVEVIDCALDDGHVEVRDPVHIERPRLHHYGLPLSQHHAQATSGVSLLK